MRRTGNVRNGSESVVVRSVLMLLQYHPRVAWSHRMNTGATKIESRVVRFGFPGCPDILGQLKDGRLLAIECKSETGRATLEQRGFLDLVRRNGGVAGIVRSIDDAQGLLA